MVLYLAGLKAVDPALKEAAVIDGANERQMFFRVVFPTLRPINIIVAGHHRDRGAARVRHRVRHQLRPQRPGTAVRLVTQNIVGEASRIGFGSAIAVILLLRRSASSSST